MIYDIMDREMTDNPISVATNDSEQSTQRDGNDDDYHALLQKVRRVKTINYALRSRIKEAKSRGPVKTEKIRQLDTTIIKSLLQANLLNYGDEDMLILRDELQKYGVLPISSDCKLRKKLARRFIPTISIIDPKVSIDNDERITSFTLSESFKLSCQLVLHHSSSTFKRFKIVEYQRESLGNFVSYELAELMDRYFKVVIMPSEDSPQGISVSQLEWADGSQTWELELKQNMNLTSFLNAINSYCLQKVKRSFILLNLVKYFKDILDESSEIFHCGVAALIAANSAQMMKYGKGFTYDDELGDIDDSQLFKLSYDDPRNHIAVDRLLNRLGISLNQSFEDTIIEMKMAPVTESSTNRKWALMGLVKNSDRLRKIRFANENHTLTICWDLGFDMSSTDFAATSQFDSLVNEETHIKYCQPESRITATVVSKNNLPIPEAYENIDEILNKLIQRKGIYEGTIIFVENFFDIEKE
ncbi:hypothetical protein DASC09_056480 [Saccharomycopsis crataegensis]|uniref:Uncharacterized protein n=1 Tax=Saccharomycopsis crataegensis TaxID=43959 RepID=A0AAV5QUY3_9ASCO|nr:hypothetical protein DASC09_056480 [Saccharomycopsis crataegensis]